MRSKEHPDLANRILAFAGAVCLVGFCLWAGIGVTESTLLPGIEEKISRPDKPEKQIKSPLSITLGPKIVRRNGQYDILWHTSAPSDVLLTYGWSDPFQYVLAEENEKSPKHRFHLPESPLMDLHRFHIRSMDASGNVVTATVGGGTAHSGSVLSDISSRYPDICDDIPKTKTALWADFDADGDLDLTFGTATGPRLMKRVVERFHDITANSSPKLKGTPSGWADTDGDGDLDLLCAGKKLFVYLNSGSPGCELTKKRGNISTPQGIKNWQQAQFAELNRDGKPDIVARLPDGSLRYFSNSTTNSPGFQPLEDTDLPSKIAGRRLLIGDIDDDHVGEVITRALLEQHQSSTEITSPTEMDAQRQILSIGDFDNDGQVDLLAQYGGKNGDLALLRNKGSGHFRTFSETGAISKIKESVTCCATGDLTGNGYLDLVLNLQEQGMKIYFNAGDGKFIDATSLCDVRPDDPVALAISVVDITGDAAPDIYAIFQNQTARIFENRSPAARRGEFMTVRVDTPRGAIGARIRVRDTHGSAIVGSHQILGGLEPLQYSLGIGNHRESVVELLLSHGVSQKKRWIRGESGNLLVFGGHNQEQR